jgi:hypothetical protein
LHWLEDGWEGSCRTGTLEIDTGRVDVWALLGPLFTDETLVLSRKEADRFPVWASLQITRDPDVVK